MQTVKEIVQWRRCDRVCIIRFAINWLLLRD